MAPASADRLSSATVARVVFVLLVVATVGAFFVAQRLKRADPVVRGIVVPKYISPNGDGFKDRARFAFSLPKPDFVTVSITNANLDEVRRLADRHLSSGRHVFYWNGRNASGAVPPDGFYYLRVILRDQNRGTITRRGVQLVTKRPGAKLVSVFPERVATGSRAPVSIRFSGPANPPPVFSVYRTDLPGRPRRVAQFAGQLDAHVGVWDGTVQGRPAPAGTYAFGVTVRNAAFVAGTAPRRLPPTPREALPHTGVTIAGPAAAPPLEPVRPGSVAGLALTGASGRVRWSLTRLGATKPVSSGQAAAPLVAVRVPPRSATGVYLARLRAPEGATTVPIAVRGSRPGRVLVVLPTITWQGLNPVDDDADGFPDILPRSPAVPLDRPLAGGRLPAGFDTDVAPLLRFLDSHRLRYDLTTDLALALGHLPALGARPGVVFAGSERWFTEDLDRRLRAYVDGGGKVASFGTDAFRRTIEVLPTQLAAPGPPQSTNALGEQVAPASSAAAPLVVAPGDALGLFTGTDGFVGLFTSFEQSQGRVSGTRVLAAAGRDPRHPAFVAYRLGRGLVVRIGTPQWSSALASDPEVASVTTSLWSLLSR